MQLKMFCVYDCKVEAYLQPFFMISKGDAIRAFTETCHDPKTKFHKYPEDFTLFELGHFDDSNAKFVLHSTPTSIIRANEVIGIPKPVAINT